MRIIEIAIPDEMINLLGSEEQASKEAKEALVLDLVRRGKVSRAKAAELMGISLWDLPELLHKYRIPWFDYTQEDLQKDLDAIKESEISEGSTD